MANRLGEALSTLIREQGTPLRHATCITGLPSVRRAQRTFRLELGNGALLKGQQLKSAERARVTEKLYRRLGKSFAPLRRRCGDTLLIEWVEGIPINELPVRTETTIRRCGELLGALHRMGTDGLKEEPLPTVHDLTAKLESRIGLLCRNQVLEEALATHALAEALESRPQGLEQGIIHRDFTGSNVVLCPNGVPVCVDNATLALGPYDLDLAVTWSRWPLSPNERAQFAAGYERHRSLTTFLKHFPFWAISSLVGSAWLRHREQTPRQQEPLRRLRGLLEFLRQASDEEHPYWVV